MEAIGNNERVLNFGLSNNGYKESTLEFIGMRGGGILFLSIEPKD